MLFFVYLSNRRRVKEKEGSAPNSFYEVKQIALQLINCKHTRIAPHALSISGFGTVWKLVSIDTNDEALRDQHQPPRLDGRIIIAFYVNGPCNSSIFI